MRKRIFIAINIPDDIRQKLLEFKKYWQDLPVYSEQRRGVYSEQRRGAQWIKPENIHVTLVFIGYISNGELKNIERVIRETAERHSVFWLTLSNVLLGPLQGPPRMVWAEIKKTPELLDMQKDLENSLYETPDTGYDKKEVRPYSPHITLCRFDTQDFNKLSLNKDEKFDIDLSFPVNSIEIMESTLLRTGAEYKVIKSVNLLIGYFVS